jgi:hypothetical protein
LFELKKPQIKNVSWEEINASWEGLFGYTNRLRRNVVKREIMGALYDLEKMRETESFDNILLDIWEKKFHKWINEIELMKVNNKQNMYF